MSTRSVRIIDNDRPCSGRAVTVIEDGDHATFTIDRAQLLDDPEGVMLETFRYLNVVAERCVLKPAAVA